LVTWTKFSTVAIAGRLPISCLSDCTAAYTELSTAPSSPERRWCALNRKCVQSTNRAACAVGGRWSGAYLVHAHVGDPSVPQLQHRHERLKHQARQQRRMLSGDAIRCNLMLLA
jgi:hypothetical protein